MGEVDDRIKELRRIERWAQRRDEEANRSRYTFSPEQIASFVERTRMSSGVPAIPSDPVALGRIAWILDNAARFPADPLDL